jgi:hypothetical protein
MNAEAGNVEENAREINWGALSYNPSPSRRIVEETPHKKSLGAIYLCN